jgi:hypothetical protein
MKLVSGSLLVTLVSTTAWAAAPNASPAPAPEVAQGAAAAVAVSPERLDLARKFVALTLSEDKYFDLMRMGALQAASEKVLSSADGADTPPETIEQGVDMVFAKIRPVLHAQMPKLLEAYALAYAREYSADDLRGMVAFAQSPAGRHYLGNPEFILGDPGVLQAQMELQEAIEPIGQEFRKEACAKRAAERIAAGDKKATCPLSNPTRAG